MGLIVQKFGGSSVKDRDRIFNVARIVMNTRNAGNDVVVVVSAQGDTTDDLITKAAEITSDPSHREMDMLLAAGEEISISLLTMALQELGVSAISLTGWQAGFNTDRAYSKARIKRLDTERVESELARNRVVVVAGFQGLNRSDDITTLGRGGSDTSAVALAAALHADRCQIFTDVEGVYTADPRKIPKATKLKEITFDEMLELASLGAQVLNNRSVELAKKYNVELEVISSINPVPGTVVKEETKVEGMLIKGVAKDTDVAVLTVKDVPDVPGMSFKIFSLLAQKNINVDIILQTTGRDGKKDMSFTVPLGDAENAVAALKNATNRIGGGGFTLDGTEYHLYQNDGENTLHGGKAGFQKKVWQATPVAGDTVDSVKFHYVSADMEENFPGNLTADVTISWDDDCNLTFHYQATTDKATIINMTNHTYFNLAGYDHGTVRDHAIYIDSDVVTAVDSGLIPTGGYMPVSQTPLDLREEMLIGDGLDCMNECVPMRYAKGYDCNYVLRKGSAMGLCACVHHEESGRTMEVITDQPGVQFYTACTTDYADGKGGMHYLPYSGLCLETQHYPDSPNHPNFPTTTLRPGEIYDTTTIYAFRVDA